MRGGRPSNLDANNFVYERAVDLVGALEHGSYERLDAAIGKTARLAWVHHVGRFADGALENPLLRVGRERTLGTLPEAGERWETPRARTTMYVATEIYSTGGHTRILARWIEHDRTSNHVVVLTAQHVPVPGFFAETVARAGGKIVQLPPHAGPLERAGAVRALTRRADRVILATHPHDTVPIVALASSGGPPVAMFNHAHFSLTLGPGVSDVIVNAGEFFRGMSERYRFARHTASLVFMSGTARPGSEPLDKGSAKTALGFAADAQIALSVGNAPYYLPNSAYDFFRMLRQLLKRHRELHVLMMGPARDNVRLIPADLLEEPRLHVLGRIVDPVPYYRAADVFLESYPMPSLGAVAEAVVHGEAFPVPVYGAEGILRLPQEPLFRYRYRPLDEEDYIAHVIDVLGKLPEARDDARRMRESILAIDREWSAQLDGLNEVIDGLQHEPAEIPITQMMTLPDCRMLAEWNPLQVGREIDRILPFRPAIRAHLAAARGGFETRREAVQRIRKRAQAGLRARVGNRSAPG